MEEIVFENLGKRTTDNDIRDFLEVTKTLNYLLIDGSLWDGDAETACLLNPNFRSLYRGAAAEKWGSVAPLLFSMEPKSTFERWVRKKDPIERRVVWLYAECDIDELRYISLHYPQKDNSGATITAQGVSTGAGVLPSNSDIALGGMGHLIIDNLKYGHGNLYMDEVPDHLRNRLIETGDPCKDVKKYLRQRNSLKFKYIVNEDTEKNNERGKVCVGINNIGMFIIAQNNNNKGWSYYDIQNYSISLGCKHALFFNGGSSAMLYDKKEGWIIKQGVSKDLTCRIGIAFKQISSL